MPEIFGAALMGGGSGPAYAAISVTYPAGATCTCALGSKTFTAPDTSGQALFIVPTAGDWIITAVLNGENDTYTVQVSAPTVYTVALSVGTWLYKNGNQYPDFTGGWQSRGWLPASGYAARGTPQLSAGPESLIGTWDYDQDEDMGVLEIINDIDLTDYDTLVLNYTYDIVTVSAGMRLGVGNRNSTYWITDAVAITRISGATQGTLSLDISQVSGPQDVYIGCGAGAAGRIAIIEIFSLELQ